MKINSRSFFFFSHTAMLDIIENDLLKKHLPTVSYMRLDGSVPANMRNEIVAKFNNDPSIDILLLTTQVTLNLIVIFIQFC
jgi:TATA-binding protein-associated factor